MKLKKDNLPAVEALPFRFSSGKAEITILLILLILSKFPVFAFNLYSGAKVVVYPISCADDLMCNVLVFHGF
jgi:hypothetical protein